MLRGRWFHIIVLNIHAPTEDKTDYVKGSFYEELERIFDKLSKYHENFVSKFYCQSRQRSHFKLTAGNESLHEISNDNGVCDMGHDRLCGLVLRGRGSIQGATRFSE
jgi:hypothetical protein